jgi:predicted site-specific integrase-resolvase
MRPMSKVCSPPRWEDLPELLNCDEVTALLRVSPNTVYELSRSGFLKTVVVQIGKQKRYPKAKLRALLEEEQGEQ